MAYVMWKISGEPVLMVGACASSVLLLFLLRLGSLPLIGAMSCSCCSFVRFPPNKRVSVVPGGLRLVFEQFFPIFTVPNSVGEGFGSMMECLLAPLGDTLSLYRYPWAWPVGIAIDRGSSSSDAWRGPSLHHKHGTSPHTPQHMWLPLSILCSSKTVLILIVLVTNKAIVVFLLFMIFEGFLVHEATVTLSQVHGNLLL